VATLVKLRTLSAAKLRIGMTVVIDGVPRTITGRGTVKSELHGLKGITQEADQVWLFFADRPMLSVAPTDRLEVLDEPLLMHAEQSKGGES
jgi:hypothetical protein